MLHLSKFIGDLELHVLHIKNDKSDRFNNNSRSQELTKKNSDELDNDLFHKGIPLKND